MKQRPETKGQFMQELKSLERRLTELEESEAECKRTVELLREGEAKYHALFNGVKDGIVLIDSETGFIVDCNPEFESQTGRKLKQLKQMKIWEIRPPEKILAAKKKFVEIKEKGFGGSVELEFQKPDGKIGSIEFLSRRIMIGGTQYLQSTARDITKRRQREEVLQKQRHNLDERVKELNCLYSISELVEKAGISMEGILEDTVNLIPPAWQYPEITCARIVFNSQEFRTKNWRETEWKQSSDIEVCGERAGILEVCYLEDRLKIDEGSFLKEERRLIDAVTYRLASIIQRKRVERELQSLSERESKSAREWQELFDASIDIMALISPDFEILRINRAGCEGIGKKREELIGKKCYEVVHGLHSPIDGCPCQDTMRTKKAGVGEITQGGRHYIATASPVLDKSDELVAFAHTITDITERKKNEQELTKYRDHLEKLVEKRTAEVIAVNNKLKQEITKRKRVEKEREEIYKKEKKLRYELEAQLSQRIEFTRALVHELKTPLTPLLGASGILVSRLKDKTLRRIAKNINQGANNLDKRINDLFDLVKGEIGMLHLSCEKVNAIQMLNEVVDYMVTEAESKGQLLTLELPASLPTVWCDEDRLRQVILNLLSNASKFTPEKGKINLKAYTKDTNFVVEIEDNGCGIAKKDQEWLFEPYHTLRTKGDRLSGLGLGLPLSKMLVELHGGQMCVKSRSGMGSTFSFSIPLTGQ